MGRLVEPLNGGLVTSQSESLLAAGELAECTNAAYRGQKEGLFSCPMRSSASLNVSADIYGIRSLIFDNGTAYFAIQTVSEYKYASISTSMTFASMPGSTTGAATSFDAVQVGNRYFLLNGVTNYVVSQGPTARAMGLSAVTGAPGLATATGVWSAPVTGWFEYWTTEEADFTENGATTTLESTFSGSPASIQVTSTSQTVRISRPNAVNSSAVRWKIYRAGPKSQSSDVLFPVGFALQTVSTSEGWFQDGVSSSLGFNAATATAATTDWNTTSITAVTGSDDVWASAMSTTATLFSKTHTTLGYFGASPAVQEPVAGIQIELEAHYSRSSGFNGGIYLSLSGDAGTTWTQEKTAPISSTTDVTVTVPVSTSDPWTRSDGNKMVWTSTMLNDTNFRVRMRAVNNSVAIPLNMAVDRIRAKVYYNGTPPSATETPFPGYTIEVGGAVIRNGSNGRPPVASCGDVFEDRLVLNDVSDASLIRYSLAGKPEYFPPDYYINFETKQNDQVKAIRLLGDRLIVLLDSSIYRVNYLPTESDVGDLNRGRAIELVSDVHGVVNKQSHALFRNHLGQQELAFVSLNGLYATDGYVVRHLSKDIKWEDLHGASLLGLTYNGFLRNNPEESELLLGYSTDSVASGSVYMMRFNYHPRHIKGDGYPKVSGPENITFYTTGGTARRVGDMVFERMRSGSSQGIPYLWYALRYTGSADARVYAAYYLSDSGYPTTSFPGKSTDHAPSIKTRRMFPGGIASESLLSMVHLHRQSWTDVSVQNDHTLLDGNKIKTDSYAQTALPTKTFTVPVGTDAIDVVSQVNYNEMGEGFQFQLHHAFTGTVGALDYGRWRYDALAIDGEDFGDEDSGK